MADDLIARMTRDDLEARGGLFRTNGSMKGPLDVVAIFSLALDHGFGLNLRAESQSRRHQQCRVHPFLLRRAIGPSEGIDPSHLGQHLAPSSTRNAKGAATSAGSDTSEPARMK